MSSVCLLSSLAGATTISTVGLTTTLRLLERERGLKHEVVRHSCRKLAKLAVDKWL